MGLRVLIDGVDQTANLAPSGRVRITEGRGQRPTAVLVCRADYIPDRFAPVIIYEDNESTTRFGGVIAKRQVTGLARAQSKAQATLRCVGWLYLTDYCSVTLSYDSDVAVEDVINDIMTAALTSRGFTYTPGNSGLTLKPFSVTNKKVAEVFRMIEDVTGGTIEATPEQAIVFAESGETSAPTTITNSTKNIMALSWEDDDEVAPTTVVVQCGPTGAALATQHWTADGSTTEFEVDIQALVGGWTQGYIRERDSGGTLIADRTLSQPSGGGYYEWDDTDGKGTVSVGAGSTPANGVQLELIYTAVFPFRVSATLGTTPDIEVVVEREDIVTVEHGQQVADGLLSKLGGNTRTFTVEHKIHGFKPNQTTTIATDTRGSVNESVVTSEVQIQVGPLDVRRYVVRAKEAGGRSSFLDDWREFKGGGGGGSSSLVFSGGGSGGSVTAVPWAFLGGARNTSETIDSAGTYEPVPQYVDYVAPASYTGRVRVQLRAGAAGQTVTARLLNTTDSTTAGTSSGVTGTTFTEVTFVVAITAGKRYRLAVTSDTAGGRAYAVGTLEAA